MKILRGTNFCINVVWLRDTQISRLLRLTVGTSSFLSLVFPPTPPIIGGSEETDKIIIIYLNHKFGSFSIGPSSLLQDIQNELRSLTSSLFFNRKDKINIQIIIKYRVKKSPVRKC